uniref:Uncharacterized protein n=1 Tax=Anopheles minimus TaxID=112268 RepID=A0A182W0D3_9DIPT
MRSKQVDIGKALYSVPVTVEAVQDGADGGGAAALTMSLKKASRTKSLSLSGDDFPLRPVTGTGNVTGKPKAAFCTAKRPEDTLKIMKYIDDNVIGKGVAFLGPYGRRKDD